MTRPPVSTKYVNARLLGSPGLSMEWLFSSYLRAGAKRAGRKWIGGVSGEGRSWEGGG